MRIKDILIASVAVVFALSVPAATVNVKDMGAVGDGVTDDWVPIQKALSTAGEDDSLTVVVPAGTYRVGKTLSIFSNTTLQLAENATIMINDESWLGVLRGQHRTASGDDCPMDATCTHGGYTQLRNVKVMGGTLEHRGANGGDAYILQLQHGDGITLENLSCKGNVRHHFNCSGSRNVVVRNVMFLPSDTHPYVIPTDELELADMRLREAIHVDFTSAGTELAYPLDDTPCRDVTVTDCTFDRIIAGVGTHRHVNAYGESEPVAILAERITITNCVFNSILSYAASMYGFDDSSFVGNRVVCKQGIEHAPGVRVNGVGSVRVSDNQISGSASHGIIVESLDGEELAVCIERNHVESSGLRGISISGSRVSAVVNDNIVDRTTSHGLFVYDSATVTASGNTLANAGDCAVAVIGKGTTVDFSEGTILSSGVDGVLTKSDAEIIIADSTFKDVGQYGVLLREGVSATIRGCTFDSPAKAGVFLDAPGPCLVENNTFMGAGATTYAALYAANAVRQGEKHLQILGNNFTASKSSGIYVKWSSDVSIVGNIIDSATGGGIYYNSSTGGIISSNTVKDVSTFGILVMGDESTVASAEVVGNNVATANISTSPDINISARSNGCIMAGNVCGHNGIAISSDATNVTYYPADVKIKAISWTSANTARVTWNNLVGVSGYFVEYSTSPDFSSCSKSEDITNGSEQCDISGLLGATVWYVRVRSYHNYPWASSPRYESVRSNESVVKTEYTPVSSTYYSIHFYANGGEGVMADQDGFVVGVQTVLNLNSFTRSGYNFVGWALSAGATTAVYTDGAEISEAPVEGLESGDTITFYAVWSVDSTKYSVHFDGNGATAGTMPDQLGFTPSKGGKNLDLNKFTRKGYDFLGWAKFPKSTDPLWTDGAEMKTTTPAGTTLTVYAVWKLRPEDAYTLHFDGNGALFGEMSDVTGFMPGVEGVLPKNKFTNTGYNFLGWALRADASTAEYDDEDEFVSDALSGSTVTLYAVWALDATSTYTVRFDGNGATSGTMADQYGFVPGKGGRALSLNRFARTGYKFLGWAKFPKSTTPLWTDGVGLNTTSTSVGDTLVVYAVWMEAADTYSISFEANGGEGVMPMQQGVSFGVATKLLKNTFTRKSYIFNGWVTSAGAVYGDEANFTSSSSDVVTLSALWTEDLASKEFTVTFDASGGAVETYQAARVVKNGNAVGNLPVPSRTNHIFDGWYTAKTGGVLVSAATTVTSDVTFYARWTFDISNLEYTVTFDANGGSVLETSRVVKHGKAVGELPVPTRAAYIFNGWYTAKTGGTSVSAATTVTSDVTFHAQWTLDTSNLDYTVTFDVNGSGAVLADKTRTVKHGNSVGDLPTPARSGYAFSGWYTARTSGTKITSGTKVTSDTAFYAHWDQTYTITLDLAGGKCDSSTVFAVKSGGSLPDRTVTRYGHAFQGFFTEPDGAGVKYYDASGKGVKAWDRTEGATLYASWASDGNFTVVLHQNNGTGTELAVSVEGGKDSLLPAAGDAGKGGLGWAPRRGFKFMGWSLKDTDKTVAFADKANMKSSFTAGGMLDLYAVWQLDTSSSYAIQYIRNDGSGSVRTVGFKCGEPTKLNSANGLGFLRRGYDFLGWTLTTQDAKDVASGGKEPWRQDMGIVSETTKGKLLKLYASWRLKEGYYSIRFYKNDVENPFTGKWRELGYEYGKNTTLPTVKVGFGWEREGYTFVGWATSRDNAKAGKIWRGDAGVTTIPVDPGKTLTLFAVWAKDSASVASAAVCTGKGCASAGAAVAECKTVQALVYFADGDSQPVEARIESDGFTVVELDGAVYCGYIENGVGELAGASGDVLMLLTARSDD